jgi:hypothetical protein
MKLDYRRQTFNKREGHSEAEQEAHSEPLRLHHPPAENVTLGVAEFVVGPHGRDCQRDCLTGN